MVRSDTLTHTKWILCHVEGVPPELKLLMVMALI